MIDNCEECSYDDYSFNKFHCSKCSNGLNIGEDYKCGENNQLMILLGFANYTHIQIYQKFTFFTYVVYVKKSLIVPRPKFIILKAIIRYIIKKNRL